MAASENPEEASRPAHPPAAARSAAGASNQRARHRIFGDDDEPTTGAYPLAIFGLWAGSTQAAPIGPEEAGSHVGESATVCGLVASAKFATNSRSQPTFLDMGRPYPNSAFTAVIFGDDRPKFGAPEMALRGKRICVTGEIRDYRGKPEIILNDPSQLTQGAPAPAR